MKNKVKLLKGKGADIVATNVNSLKNAGFSHNHATHLALKHSHKSGNNDKSYEGKQSTISTKTSVRTEKLDNEV